MKRVLLVIVGIIPLFLSGITLERSIELSLAKNRELLSKQFDISKAERDIEVSKSNLLPQLSFEVGGNISNTHNPEAFTGGPGNIEDKLTLTASEDAHMLADHMNGIYESLVPEDSETKVQVSSKIKATQLIYSGGKVSTGVKINQTLLEIQKDSYELAKENVIYRTKELFYSALLTRDVLQITKDSWALANKHYQQVKLMNEEGMSSDYDLLRAELEVSRLEPAVEKAINDYKMVISALEQHLGNSSIDVIEGDIVLPMAEDISLNQCYIELIDNRIELKMANKKKQIEKYSYKIAKSDYLPSIGLNSEVGIFAQDEDMPTDSDYYGYSYSIGIGFSIPLFTGFSTENKIKKAKLSLKQVLNDNADMEDKLRLEVKQNHLELGKTWKTVRTMNKNLELAESGFAIATTRYENQLGIQLELIDAQLQLKQAKLELKNATYNTIMATEKLHLSLGRKLN